MADNDRMKVFRRDDGRPLRVVDGFRERVLSAPRVSANPKPDWSDEDYVVAARKRVRHVRRILSSFAGWGGAVNGARVLEVGCGAGIDCVLLGRWRVRHVVGIDLQLPLFEAS